MDKPSDHWSKTPSFARVCNLTNRVTCPLGVCGLTSMKVSSKFNGVLDALPLDEIIHSIYVINNIIKIAETRS